MSRIDTTIYPAGTTSLKGINLCSYTLNHYLDNTPWENSIAISQSTSERAPFNKVTNFVPYNGTLYVKEFSRNVQQIALTYISTGYNFGSNQYTSWNYSPAVMNSVQSSYWYTRSLGKTQRAGSVISQIQSHYNPSAYNIVVGLNVKNVLGVICVALRSQGTIKWCSLKYYLDNKNNITETPCGLFMNIYYGNSENENPNTRRCLAPIDLTTNDVFNWRLSNNSLVEESTTNFASLFPPSVFRGMTYYEATSGGNVFKEDFTTNIAIIAPLIGCMNGMVYLANENNWTNITTQAGTVYGGVKDTDYTLNLSSGSVSLTLTQAAFDRALSTAATYGIPFSNDFPNSPSTLFSSSNTTYMPVPNEGGYFDGQFETLTVAGVETQYAHTDPIWNSNNNNSAWNDRTYDPTIPISTDIIDLIQPSLTPIDCFNKTYILNRDDVEDLADILWTSNQTIIDQMIDLFKNWHAAEAIDGIINLMLFPFDVRTKTGATTIENVVIGKYVSPIQAYRLGDAPSARYNLGSFKWRAEYNNTFLDYSPYTEAELYIPYFGTMPIAPEHFLNKTISIDLIVDFTNGSATIIIFVEENNAKHPVIYKNGNIAVQIPLSSNRSVEQQKQILQNALNFGGGLKTRFDNLMGGGRAEPSAMESMPNLLDGNGQLRLTGPVQPQGETNALVSAAKLGGEMAAAHPAAKVALMAGQMILSSLPAFTSPSIFNEAGASTPDCALYLPNKPYIILYRPKLNNLENYGHLVGYATMEDCTIGSCSGFSKFSNVDLSGLSATEEEKRLILNYLESGVYL